MIPMSETHLRSILREWVAHYKGGRPHSTLGPGIPGPPAGSARAPKPETRRLWTPGALVRAKSVRGGLHHEYSLWSTPALPWATTWAAEPMTENAEVLKSGVVPAGPRFCGVQPRLT
jgi:hypothetical protein